MKLYNTPDRKIVDFIPIEPGKVSFYACGPTVYNFAHIGNLRTYVFEDVLRRALELEGYEVNHVMNVTDVGHLTDDGDEGEDKMIKSAREKGMSVWDIAKYFTDAFFEDCKKLNILRPKNVCAATDHIGDMIALIQRLEDRGLTYISGGNVYYNTAEFPDYGKLAGLEHVDLHEGHRIEVDENKKDPRDFVLWFTKGKFENQAMIWDSPWGRGYPGWHLECSAMSMKYLGDHFDIHAGGVDHIPVHHTNEIAQSEGATGKKWVNYWIHGEFLLTKNAKMSKSSGSFLTITELEKQGFHPLDYRFFCLGGHYRSQLTFTFEALTAAKTARANLEKKVREMKKRSSPQPPPSGSEGAVIWEDFLKDLANDLSMPKCLAHLWKLLKIKASDSHKLFTLYQMDQILGLGLEDLEVQEDTFDVPPAVLLLAEERTKARKERNFARADQIRDELTQMGWVVVDTPKGPELKKL